MVYSKGGRFSPACFPWLSAHAGEEKGGRRAVWFGAPPAEGAYGCGGGAPAGKGQLKVVERAILLASSVSLASMSAADTSIRAAYSSSILVNLSNTGFMDSKFWT